MAFNRQKPCRVKCYQLNRASRTEGTKQCICFWRQRSQLNILGKENVEKVFADIMDMKETLSHLLLSLFNDPVNMAPSLHAFTSPL